MTFCVDVVLLLKIMNLKIKKLSESAVLPSYASDGDAGMDLVAVSVDKSNNKYWEYNIGLALEIPRGFVGLLFPRSSISKTSHAFRNSVGVIDSGYRGEVKIRMSMDHSNSQYKEGDRVAQLVIVALPWVEVEEVKELSSSQRDQGGFGSTGK